MDFFWRRPFWLLIIVVVVINTLDSLEILPGAAILGTLFLISIIFSTNRDLKKEGQKNWDLVEENNHLKEKFIELKENFLLLEDNVKYQNSFLKDLVTGLKDEEYLREDMIMDIKEKIKTNNEELKYCTLKDFEDLDLKKNSHLDI